MVTGQVPEDITPTVRPAWFVRSMADGDTHHGLYSPATGTVRARCGTTFTPVPVGWPPHSGPLPGHPADPAQVCPQCQKESK